MERNHGAMEKKPWRKPSNQTHGEKSMKIPFIINADME